jgi:hypothetical protein
MAGSYTAQNHLYKPATGEKGWGALVDANFDTLDRPELLAIAVSAVHQAATLGALLDDLYTQTLALKRNVNSGYGFGLYGRGGYGS